MPGKDFLKDWLAKLLSEASLIVYDLQNVSYDLFQRRS